jgi:hypothetical protein
MAEVTNELLYGVLKQMQTRLGRLEDGQRELKTEVAAVRSHVIAIETDISNVYAKLAGQDLRLERIERHLHIIDEPVG